MKMKKSLITLLALLSASGVDIVLAAQKASTKSAAPKKGKKKKAEAISKQASKTKNTANKNAAAQSAAEPQDRKTTLTEMIALFKNSLPAGTMNADQKAYVQNTLIPALEKELNGSPMEKAIDNAFNQPNAAATIQAMTAVAQANQGKQLDQASQQAFGSALKDLVDTSMHLDPAVIASLANLVQTAATSNLVPQAMQPELKAVLPALAPMPNVQNATLVANLQDPQEKIDAMQALVDKAGGRPIDPQTRNIFAGTLQGLVSKAKLLDPMDMIRLSGLVGSAATSTLLTPEQQQYVQNNLAPAVQVPISPDLIQKIMATGTPAEKMAALQQLMNQYNGVPLDPATQNAFAQALTQLSGQMDTMTPQERAAFTNLLGDASQGTFLSPAQQQYVQTQMIPAVAPKPTIENINQAMSLQDPAQRMEALRALMVGAKPPIDPAVQNAYAQALQTLQGQVGSMSPAEQAQFRTLLTDAGSSSIISPAQQEYVTKTMLPATVPAPTAASIQTVMQGGDPSEQLSTLEIMMQKQGSNPADPATQAAYNKALQELLAKAQRGELPPEDEARLQKLLIASGQSGLLDAQNQQLVIQQAGTLSPDVTPSRIQTIMAPGKSAGKQIDSLLELVQQQGGAPADPETQKAYNIAIQDLMAKAQRGELTDAEKLKLQKLLEASGQSGLLSGEQQKIVIQQAGSVAPKPSAGVITSVMQGGSANDQLDSLEMLLKQQGNNPADPATQNAYAQAIQELMKKAQAGQLSPEEQLRLQKLMIASGQSGLLNGEQQKFVVQQSGSVAPKPSAATIQSIIQGNGSAADQIDSLELLLQQQGNNPADPATQDAYNKAIQALMAKMQAGQLSPQEQAKLQKLMIASGQSGLLNQQQQQLVVQQAGSVKTKPSAAGITTLMQGGSAADQLNGLELMLEQQGNNPADPATQNAYALAIQELMKKAQAGQLSPQEQLKLQKLMLASGQGGLLNGEQQKFVLQQAGGVAPKPSAGVITSVMQGGSANDQLDSLEMLLKQQGNNPADPATQNAYALAIQELMKKAQAGQLSPQEQLKLQKLMLASGQGGLLNADQQKFVLQQAGGVAPKPSAGVITSVMQGGSTADQLDNLELLLQQQGNNPADPATQDAYNKAIQELMKKAQAGQLSPQEQAKLQKLMIASGQSGLLNQQQQQLVIQQAGSVKSKPSAAGITTIMQGGSAADQLNGLELMLEQQGNNPADPATQNAYALAIQELMKKAQAGQLSPQEQLKLQKLMLASGQGGLLNADQQKFVIQQAGGVAPKPSAGVITSVMQGGSANDQLDSLEMLLKQQGNNPADPATQNAYALAIQELMKKAQAGQLSPQEQLKLQKLMLASGQGGLLNADQQKFVIQQAGGVAPKPSAGVITSVMQGGSANDQLDSLEMLLKQQGNNPADPATQNAYALAIQELMKKAQAGQLSPQEQAKLQKLMLASGKGGLLNAEQQKFVIQQAGSVNGGAGAGGLSIQLTGQGGAASSGAAASQLAELEALLQQQGGKPANPQSQAANLKLIQELMAKQAAGELSAADTSKLQLLLQSAQQQGAVPKGSVNDSLTKLMMNMGSGGVGGYEGSDQSIVSIESFVKNNAGKKFSQQDQNNFALKLQQMFGNVNNMSDGDKDELRNLLEFTLNTDMLSPEQKEYVRNNMIPQLAKATMKQLDDLDKLMAQGQDGSMQGSTAEQNAVADRIMVTFRNRPRYNVPYLMQFRSILVSLLSGPLLSRDQKRYVETTMIPAIDDDIQGGGTSGRGKKGGRGRSSSRGNAFGGGWGDSAGGKGGRGKKSRGGGSGGSARGNRSPAQAAFDQEADAVANLFSNSKGKNLSPEERNTAAGRLQQLFDNRAQDAESLEKTRDALRKALESGQLSPEQEAHVRKLLGQVEQDLAKAAGNAGESDKSGKGTSATGATGSASGSAGAAGSSTEGGIANATADQIKSFLQEVKELSDLIDPKKKYSAAEQNAIAAKIQGLFAKRPLNDADALEQFRNALLKALDSDALTPEQKEYIRKTLLAQLEKDIANARRRSGSQVTVAGKSAPTAAEIYNGQLAKIDQFIQNARPNTAPSVQQSIATLVQDMFAKRPTKEANTLTRLANQLTKIKQTTLVHESFKKEIDTMLKTISSDQRKILTGGK